MNKTLKIILGIVPLVALCITIFWFSQHDKNESLGQSARVVAFIKNHIFPQLNNILPQDELIVDDVLTTIVRKGAHFLAYTLLGLCSFSAFSMIRLKSIRYLVSMAFCIAFAASDEIHQLFIPGRTGKITDVLIDSCGAALGAFCCLVIVFCLVAHSNNKMLNKMKTDDVNPS